MVLLFSITASAVALDRVAYRSYRVGSTCGTEVDGAIVNQLRVYPFHSHSTGAADVHDAVIPIKLLWVTFTALALS